jgi:hypothetical protein
MAYIGKSMSENAFKAHLKGLFVKSQITAQFLKSYDFKYSVKFFKWLIDKKYIKPVEFHHTSVTRNLTCFYSPNVIGFANNYFNLDTLYKLYLKKVTKEEIKKMLNIKYVRLVLSTEINNQYAEYTYDCISCKEKLYWDKSTIIISASDNVRIIEEFYERPAHWNNPYTRGIIKTLMIYKNPDIKTRIY